MEIWIIYAILSMIFAGMTAILIKYGLEKINPDLGLGIRITVIFFIIAVINIVGEKYKDLSLLTGKQLTFLIVSGVTTTLSWLFYYRAIKEGPVSYVAAIDKGSVVITILLSYFLLKEPLTPKLIIGAALMIGGLLILTWK